MSSNSQHLLDTDAERRGQAGFLLLPPPTRVTAPVKAAAAAAAGRVAAGFPPRVVAVAAAFGATGRVAFTGSLVPSAPVSGAGGVNGTAAELRHSAA